MLLPGSNEHPPLASHLAESPLAVTISVPSGAGSGGGASAVCWLQGEVDISTTPGLGHELDLLLTLGVRRIVLDLEAVTFFGAAGVDLLVEVEQRLGPPGAFSIRQPTAMVARVLQICGVGHLLHRTDVGADSRSVTDIDDRDLDALGRAQ